MKRYLFWVLVLKGLVGLHRTVQLQLLQCWGIDLDYCDTEWFALETNKDCSVVFETAPKYCRDEDMENGRTDREGTGQ